MWVISIIFCTFAANFNRSGELCRHLLEISQLRQTLDEWDPEDQLILMQFMADAEYFELDGQGRILLQKKNLETIGAQQDVLFVGMLNRFALWAPETFAAKKLSQSELAARLRAKMSKKQS